MEANQTPKLNKNGTVNLLDLSECHSLIEMLATELDSTKRKFEIEKNIKNNLYAFVYEMDLLRELAEYSNKNEMSSPEGHTKAIKALMKIVKDAKDFKDSVDLMNN